MELIEKIEIAISNIATLYREDNLPWIVGYSGGKDSTAVLQLVWRAIETLPIEHRTKKVYVISTDTLVENPIVAKWVEVSLERIKLASLNQKMGIDPRRLVPKIEDRFWVNLIGKGYPAPRPKFRWCTSRLKINASTDFIRRSNSFPGHKVIRKPSKKKSNGKACRKHA
jgi:DNA sulfur modification protein DndC